jgi:coproporphyrinogen III oxidase
MEIRERFYQYISELQDTITAALESYEDDKKFLEDRWNREEGGGGRSRVLENGKVFEKAGVNISAVHGPLPESLQNYFQVDKSNFYACGISLVIHPRSPMVPTVHANFRYFEMHDLEGNLKKQWFGGGLDLTPYYLFDEDAKHFHQVCKSACDPHGKDLYQPYKKRCDEYFWNAHRDEARGVGGLFFDHLQDDEERSMEGWYKFVTDVGDHFLEAYLPIVDKRKDTSYDQNQKDWQKLRRGRYVEFNLVHDKGTLFGLKTKGRIESILMSLPPEVNWKYNYHPPEGSEEARLIEVLKIPKNWIDEADH